MRSSGLYIGITILRAGRRSSCSMIRLRRRSTMKPKTRCRFDRNIAMGARWWMILHDMIVVFVMAAASRFWCTAIIIASTLPARSNSERRCATGLSSARRPRDARGSRPAALLLQEPLLQCCHLYVRSARIVEHSRPPTASAFDDFEAIMGLCSAARRRSVFQGRGDRGPQIIRDRSLVSIWCFARRTAHFASSLTSSRSRASHQGAAAPDALEQ